MNDCCYWTYPFEYPDAIQASPSRRIPFLSGGTENRLASLQVTAADMGAD